MVIGTNTYEPILTKLQSSFRRNEVHRSFASRSNTHHFSSIRRSHIQYQGARSTRLPFLMWVVLILALLLICSACEGDEFDRKKCDGDFDKEDVCVVTLQDLARLTGDDAYLHDRPDAASNDAGVSNNTMDQQQQAPWDSTPWSNSPWLHFPGKMTLKIMHPLGRVPLTVLPYLAFEHEKKGCDKPSSFFPSAGDLSRIKEVTAESITLKNNTNEDFCLRVVLE